MSNTSGSPLEVLKAFIQTEMEGNQFYQVAAERTQDTRGKAMLLSLAADEVEHARKLAGEYSSLVSNGPWLSLEELSSRGQQASFPVFQTDPQKVAELIPEGADDLQALKIAVDVEKRSYEEYARAAEESSDEAAKALFRHLAVEEKRHLLVLESSYEYLADTGSWFQSLEKPIFEG